jgi:ABC-type glycerol-3-phosphate transport system substrate-binding protein
MSAILMTIILIAMTLLITSKAEEIAQTVEVSSFSVNSLNHEDYGDYLKKYSDFEFSNTNVSILGSDFIAQDNSEVIAKEELKSKENVLLWESGKGSVTWEFDIENAGLYNFQLVYLPLKSGTNIEYSLYLDGEIPFYGADKLVFTRDWVNATEKPRTDNKGNEISPEQAETGEYVTRKAVDDVGVVIDAYCFALTNGTHTITLEGKGYPVAISELLFTSPETNLTYKELSKNYNVKENNSVEPILIHAENASIKSDKTLIPKSTNGNAGMYPVHPYITKLNNIGGSSWNTPGQALTWDFSVPNDGYYIFGARYKQNELVGGESWRWLKIDGKTPFEEAKELRFKYGTGWQEYVFGNGECPYYIYLEKGQHTLSLEVTLGELSSFYDRLNKIVSALGDMYLEIVMITGETPDINRDYELFSQIPTFTEVLTNASDELVSIAKDMKSLTGNNGNQYTAAINNMNRIIDRMLDAKYIAHLYVKDYYTNYTTLSSWLSEMKQMPLALDEMQFIYAGQEFDWNQPNIFKKIAFGFERLIYSFAKDYISETKQEDAEIKLWVNWGRDQTMALDSLIRDSFTSKTGIKVELQIVSNSIINGLLANNFPDLQLYLARTDPVNFGMRGALLDLTQFPDYKEVLTRFAEGADTPYWYNGGLYALPDSQTFYCMFYREDVFKQLGLKVPKTWDEFLYCATIIQRYNMSVYVPYTQIATTTTVNSGIGSLNMYPTLMLQKGLNLYNEKLDATNLLTNEGIKVFKEWTDMYTDYGYLKEADFYNRFRNGSMPLGIAPYTTYMTIYSAAPEIKGRWSIANVPGFTEENNYVAGGGTGCSIIKKSSHQKEAWEFLKWWTSTETQIRYSNNVESILGMLGRATTSNVEAFKNMSWNPADLEKLLSQWDKVKEIPEAPGSYYLTRAVDQAYWSVINDNINHKDAITEWSKIADNEIERKIKEYSKGRS